MHEWFENLVMLVKPHIEDIAGDLSNTTDFMFGYFVGTDTATLVIDAPDIDGEYKYSFTYTTYG